MPQFGPESERHLATCHPLLQMVLREAIKHKDFSVLCGHRGKEAQDAAFAAGYSQVQWPDGKHNKVPAEAADVRPYPYNPKDVAAAYLLNGFICGVAAAMGINLRSGADWDGDLDTIEHTLKDAPHVELA